jgi:hypothetical protein
MNNQHPVQPPTPRRALRTDQRGAALFAAVAALLILSTMMVAYSLLARDETRIAQITKNESQAAYAAEAGANHGRKMLAQRLRNDLPRVVATTSRATLKTQLQTLYSTSAGAAQFLVDYAIPAASGPTFVLCTGVTGGCPEPAFSAVGTIPDAQQVALTLTGASPAYTTRVMVGVHPTIAPVITSGGAGALFTYVWRIESTGTSGQALQQYVIHDSATPDNLTGAFTIALNAEFVRYAHFIDNMDSSQAWISYRHVYTGPVHTNGRFNILGNAPTALQEGPTFRSEATSWDNQIRFNNGGSTLTTAKDSTSRDWPLLGAAPGILCKLTDCAGLTRNYDYDPSTAAIDKIPYPSGSNPEARNDEVCVALNRVTYTIDGARTCPAAGSSPPSPSCGGSCPDVLVSDDTSAATLASPRPLNGGIYVRTSVHDLRLQATATGQLIVIETQSGNKRTVIQERRDQTPMYTTVARECRATSLVATSCTAGAAVWIPDPSLAAALQSQVFGGTAGGVAGGVLSKDQDKDVGVLFVNSGSIGQANGPNGLRRGDLTGATVSGTAIYQNPGVTTAARNDGVRLTIAADRNIYITGPLDYQVDPRGPDLIFSSPIPGDATGTSADDILDTQSVLGVVAWSNGGSGGIILARNLNGDLPLHGMFMIVNLSGSAAPSGQFSFEDPNGTYRGKAKVLGGVVQKTMGTLGQPGSPGTGYARDWVYDERLRYRALSPPTFPGFPNFTGSTSLGIDSYSWRQGLF